MQRNLDYADDAEKLKLCIIMRYYVLLCKNIYSQLIDNPDHYHVLNNITEHRLSSTLIAHVHQDFCDIYTGNRTKIIA